MKLRTAALARALVISRREHPISLNTPLSEFTRAESWSMPVIAIVDDNERFRRATVSFIRSLGYAVLQFASAEAFLKSNRLVLEIEPVI